MREERGQCVDGELGGVKSCWSQPPEILGEGFGRDRTYFRKRPAGELFGQERGTGDGGGAAAAEKLGFGDAVAFEADGELEDIAADGIADFHFCRRVSEDSRVPRITEMIEYAFAEHYRKYGHALRKVQIQRTIKNYTEFAETQRAQRRKTLK
jgi:hypothetical protein